MISYKEGELKMSPESVMFYMLIKKQSKYELWRPRRIREDNIKTGVIEMAREVVDWINLAQGRVQ
jgi:hypothetical protein